MRVVVADPGGITTRAWRRWPATSSCAAPECRECCRSRTARHSSCSRQSAVQAVTIEVIAFDFTGRLGTTSLRSTSNQFSVQLCQLAPLETPHRWFSANSWRIGEGTRPSATIERQIMDSSLMNSGIRIGRRCCRSAQSDPDNFFL
jgi:hypothetical protein